MKLNLLANMNWESKVDHAMKVVAVDSLADIDYGPGLSKLVVVLNCRDPEFGHKQRVRLAHTTKTLNVDVMFDLHFFITATHTERRRKIYEEVLGQVWQVLEKRRIKNFESERFIHDLDCLLNEQFNGETSTRLDSFCLERATGF